MVKETKNNTADIDKCVRYLSSRDYIEPEDLARLYIGLLSKRAFNELVTEAGVYMYGTEEEIEQFNNKQAL